MKRLNRLALVVVVLLLSVASLAFATTDDDADVRHLNTTVTAVGSSGISGTAAISIGEDGLRGKLKAENLKPGHAYTVWFFYFEGSAQGGPGRFDSTVAEDDDFTFKGRVLGLHVSEGATIKLVIFDHADLGPNNATRADNLLTPSHGVMVAQAVFTIP